MIYLAKFIILLSLLSTTVHASFSLPKIKWKDLNQEQRIVVLLQLREFMAELDKVSPEEVAKTEFQFIDEAYAAGFDCFVAGWPSTRNSKGRCESPILKNSHYQHYLGCREGQMLCNPTVFGDGLCIKFQTSDQKNSAYNQCEKLYAKEGRLFSEVLEASSPREFDDLVSTVYETCHVKKDAGTVCQNLKRKLQHFVPDEVPQNYESAKKLLTTTDPEKILKGAQKLQSEMEKDYSEFKRVCDPKASEENKLYCKNLSLRVKKSNELLPKLFSTVEAKLTPADCVNCSHKNQGEVLNPASLPDLSSSKKLTCSEDQKKQNRAKCDKDIYCSIGSTVFSSALVIAEALGQKPNSCISSQNDCVTNLISALVDSILSMVTGLWDLLGMLADWTGEKLGQFWDYVRGVEDKTSNAQHLLNKMSDADKKEVKTNPIKWVTNLATNIWEGIKTWMKEDIFCEKWSGIPRASECTQPAVSFDCLSCRTMIAGTCSASGVILAEVLPAFFTGGSVNVAARAGTGAKAFAKAIKVSKAYKKVATAVDKLSDIRAIRLATEGVKTTGLVVKTVSKPVASAVKTSFSKVSSGYKAFVATKGFQATSKALDFAAKYSGVKYVNKVMDEAYEYGYKFVDDVAGSSVKNQKVFDKINSARLADTATRELVTPLNDKISSAYKIGHELQELQNEARLIKLDSTLTEEARKLKLDELELKYAEKHKALSEVNKNFVNDLHEMYKKEGIHSKIVPTQTGVGLELDFTQTASTNTAFEFYKRARNRFGIDKITINLEENASHGFAGFFSPSDARMDIGPSQGLELLDEFVNSVGKHELRHSMFLAKRNRGDESIFHVQFYASNDGKHLLNDKRMYDSYMSAEEVYTYSTDLQTYAQSLNVQSLKDLAKRKQTLNEIYGHNEYLKIISTTNKNASESMLSSIDDILKGQGTDRYSLRGNFVSFADKDGRSTMISFVSESERKLLIEPQNILNSMTSAQETYVQKALVSKGVDVQKLITDIQVGKITQAEQEMLRTISTDYLKSPEAITFNKRLDESMIPAVNKAKEKLTDLKNISDIQLKEASLVGESILNYAKSGADADFLTMKSQLMKTAKNVKEDYKGFALNEQTP